MRADSTPPEPTLRPAAMVAALLAGALTIASAPGPFAFLDRPDRVPPPRTFRSHVIEAPATAQRLIPAPATGATEPRPGALPSPPAPAAPTPPPVAAPPPAPAPDPAAVPAPAPGSALAGVVAARMADPRLAGTTVGLSVWVDGLGEVAAHNADLPLTPA